MGQFLDSGGTVSNDRVCVGRRLRRRVFCGQNLIT